MVTTMRRSQPANASGVLQIAKASIRTQVGLLGRVLGPGPIAQHAPRHAVRHGLRGLDQLAECAHVSTLGQGHERSKGLRSSLFT